MTTRMVMNDERNVRVSNTFTVYILCRLVLCCSDVQATTSWRREPLRGFPAATATKGRSLVPTDVDR